jgi:transcriptional regulator with XRE-family HTH domain
MKLADYLDREGLTKTEFAKRTGLSIATVSLLARNLTWLSRDAARRISDASNGEVTAADFQGAK